MLRRRLRGNPRLFIHLFLLIAFGVAIGVGPSAQTAATPAGQGRGEPTTITGGLRWSEDASKIRPPQRNLWVTGGLSAGVD